MWIEPHGGDVVEDLEEVEMRWKRQNKEVLKRKRVEDGPGGVGECVEVQVVLA